MLSAIPQSSKLWEVQNVEYSGTAGARSLRIERDCQSGRLFAELLPSTTLQLTQSVSGHVEPCPAALDFTTALIFWAADFSKH